MPESARNERVAGRCTTHDDLAWRYEDGSVGCYHCLEVETSVSDCEWVPMPHAWLRHTVPSASMYARVVDSGGGEIRALVRRDTTQYPPPGQDVLVTWPAQTDGNDDA